MNAISLPLTDPTTEADVEPAGTPSTTLAMLVEQHQAAVWRYLRYLGAPPAEADDLTQETFLAVAQKGFSERSEQESAGYLRTVARNQLLMLRRKQRREPAVASLEAAEAVWAESRVDSHWDAWVEAAKDCVEKLAERSRRAIHLAYQDRQSRDAIANQLEMKPDGVKTLLRRARAAVRECVERTMRVE